MKIKAEHIAKLIYKARTTKRISQAELCVALGMRGKTSQYISNVERGQNQLPAKRMAAVAHLLGLEKHLIIEAMTKDYAESLLEQFNKDDAKLDKTKVIFKGDFYNSNLKCKECGLRFQSETILRSHRCITEDHLT